MSYKFYKLCILTWIFSEQNSDDTIISLHNAMEAADFTRVLLNFFVCWQICTINRLEIFFLQINKIFYNQRTTFRNNYLIFANNVSPSSSSFSHTILTDSATCSLTKAWVSSSNGSLTVVFSLVFCSEDNIVGLHFDHELQMESEKNDITFLDLLLLTDLLFLFSLSFASAFLCFNSFKTSFSKYCHWLKNCHSLSYRIRCIDFFCMWRTCINYQKATWPMIMTNRANISSWHVVSFESAAWPGNENEREKN